MKRYCNHIVQLFRNEPENVNLKLAEKLLLIQPNSYQTLHHVGDKTKTKFQSGNTLYLAMRKQLQKDLK